MAKTDLARKHSAALQPILKLQEQALAVLREGGLQDVLKIRDEVDITRVLVEKYQKNRDAANDLSAVSIRLVRRAGELLGEMDKAKPTGSNQHKDRSQRATDPPRLSDLGINKSQSSRWQKVAAIPNTSFEHHLSECQNKHKPPTLQSVLKLSPRRNGRQLPTDVVSSSEIVTDLDELAGRKFKTVYADPPWAYSNKATRANADGHYQTMTIAQICDMPIADLANKNAQLHLWTTNGFLREAFDVILAWGFSYRSCFVWCKPQMGIGNYWRVSHEFLLLGVRGSATFRDKSLKSWAETSRGKHSAKPEMVRSFVERAGHPERLEVFGRVASPGWTVFGNEVEETLFS